MTILNEPICRQASPVLAHAKDLPVSCVETSASRRVSAVELGSR